MRLNFNFSLSTKNGITQYFLALPKQVPPAILPGLPVPSFNPHLLRQDGGVQANFVQSTSLLSRNTSVKRLAQPQANPSKVFGLE